jgi:hypothetical protein
MRRWIVLSLLFACSDDTPAAGVLKDGGIDAKLDARVPVATDDADVGSEDADVVPVIPPGPLACDGQPSAWLVIVQSVVSNRRSCQSDGDCALIDASVDCSATNFHHLCKVAVTATYDDLVNGRLDARRSEFCAASKGAACSSDPDCPTSPSARCVSSVCVAQ